MPEHFAARVAGTGPGLLLAHGAGGGVDANFGPIFDDLAAARTVVGLDYPGSGATPRSTTPLQLDGLADALVAAADAAGLERFAVLGYSLGTAVAVRLASRYPDRVTGLVLTAGLARPDPALLMATDLWRALLDGDDRRQLARFLILMASGPDQLRALDATGAAAAVDAVAASVPNGTPEHVDLVRRIDTEDELPRLAVPTLVVVSTRDALVPPHLQRVLVDGIRAAQVVELACGHDVATEARDEWLAAVQKFLAEVE